MKTKRSIKMIAGTISLGIWVTAGLVACTSESKEWDELPRPEPEGPRTEYPQIEASFEMPVDARGGRILDFSRVGYRWGDEPIPSVPVVLELEAPEDGSDALEMINGAIAQVAAMELKGRHRGAILLKKGTYNISAPIVINASGIVLRGEGADHTSGTVIRGTGVREVDIENYDQHAVIRVKGSPGSDGERVTTPNIKDEYVPEGQFWVRVNNARDFSRGDEVVIHRAVNDQFVKDLGLGGIWTDLNVINRMMAQRVVTKINRDTLWFENPVPISIEPRYGGGSVYRFSYPGRIEDCGVENMALESEFFDEENESHCWMGVSFDDAVHCWMTDVSGKYFGFGLAYIMSNAKNITVSDCVCTDFQGTLGGSRRYPFFHCGQLSIFINCDSDGSRHPYATSGANTVGPNVFSGGTATRCHADAGPHRCFAQGTLYENLRVEGAFNIRNRYTNSKHGWAGTNDVAWNCTSVRPDITNPYHGFIIQSPHVSGQNYGIGCIGEVNVNTFDRDSDPPSPDGHWISHGVNVTPASLYDAQLALRRTTQPGGVLDVN